MSGNIWITIGIIAVAFSAFAIPYGFHLKGKNKAVTKIDDLKVEQKGDDLSNVTGAEISNPTTDMELGKVDIQQEGNSLKNVTGLKMKFDSNSGEVELKDKMQIKQKGSGGESSVTINADQPGVKVIFNKKSENDKNGK
jgi:hypothetical protein